MKSPTSTSPLSTGERLDLCVEAVTSSMPVEEIWLFGSHATGTSFSDSDIDLLVILPDESPVKEPHLTAIRAISRLRKGLAVDIVAVPRSATVSKNPPILVKEAFAKGRRLYDRTR